MRDKISKSDDSIDDFESFDGEEFDDVGFISTQKNTRRSLRKNIEEMLEARALKRSISEIFDDEM